MRRMVLALVAAAALVVPASASAHTDYYNVTLAGSTNTLVSGVAFDAPQCWGTVNVAPGQTKYVINPNNFTRFGLGGLAAGWHIHPADQDFVTGPETRNFHFPNGVSLGSRRVQILTGFGWLAGVRFTHQGGSSNLVIVRINC